MNKFLNVKSVVALLAVLVTVGAADTFGQRRRPVLRHKTVVRRTIRTVAPVPVEQVYSVNRGTIIRVRMNETISSKTARVGDTFTVAVTEPVYSDNGVVVVPVGSTLTGRVNMVRPASNGGRVGLIDASFVRLRLPNGRSRAINGSLTNLGAGAGGAISDNEGTASGKAMNHRKEIFIGGGGVGGAVLGAAIGGGKGALIGGLLGAGGGFLGEKYTKGKEVEVRSGTEFGVLLNQPISMPRFGEVNTVRP